MTSLVTLEVRCHKGCHLVTLAQADGVLRAAVTRNLVVGHIDGPTRVQENFEVVLPDEGALALGCRKHAQPEPVAVETLRDWFGECLRGGPRMRQLPRPW